MRIRLIPAGPRQPRGFQADARKQHGQGLQTGSVLLPEADEVRPVHAPGGKPDPRKGGVPFLTGEETELRFLRGTAAVFPQNQEREKPAGLGRPVPGLRSQQTLRRGGQGEKPAFLPHVRQERDGGQIPGAEKAEARNLHAADGENAGKEAAQRRFGVRPAADGDQVFKKHPDVIQGISLQQPAQTRTERLRGGVRLLSPGGQEQKALLRQSRIQNLAGKGAGKRLRPRLRKASGL